MNNNTSNDFCKSYVYKYIECLNINKEIFGKEHSPEMCNHLKSIIKNCNCNVEKILNISLENIENKVLNLPSPSKRN